MGLNLLYFFILLCTYIILHPSMSKKAERKIFSFLKNKVKSEQKQCTSIWRMLGYEVIIVFLAIMLINVYVLSFSVLQYFSHIKDMEVTEVGMVL